MTTRASGAGEADAVDESQRQYLSFRLGGLEYGLDFGRVQELRPLKALDRFASEGAIIGGVAVSRGVIMPIVDMRIAFSERPPVSDPMTDVIILKLSSCVMGMVVDGVTDIVTLGNSDIHPIPGAGMEKKVDYLLGLGEVDGRRLILVDIDKLMSIRKVGVGAKQAA
ncbi:chemotaxis protein CheW [Janthinobacterium fluminis]|uniref:Chemotaxis protein CheW n=1 Tax=Janthinobacterium fluminis TaxID=2987524 RepID=A0ABT5JTR2_9BURK|nr:chemotaxis protein CheW [Janthinobacterium fluminis]MDC8756143.1 chemotaxis protein CheW [Janthinobacterium fluminis]